MYMPQVASEEPGSAFSKGLAAKARLFEVLQPCLKEQRDELLAEGHIGGIGGNGAGSKPPWVLLGCKFGSAVHRLAATFLRREQERASGVILVFMPLCRMMLRVGCGVLEVVWGCLFLCVLPHVQGVHASTGVHPLPLPPSESSPSPTPYSPQTPPLLPTHPRDTHHALPGSLSSPTSWTPASKWATRRP